ncbi:hypothetical protein [Acetobacter cerevisiae]|uniref:hypothetical protein n=1 Tax=Acetobacter cerevisiae TaxID=178900 RepID=UPI0012E7E178|nr:hypothetical protein [Acetobacter cerevisiae]GBQ05505.1 hypothetical protein AA14362_0442 [Acetobacter cerevisiae DSM 14362]
MKKILNASNLDKSNIIPNTKSWVYWYFIGSILVFSIIFISLYVERVNNYSISLSVYFFMVGFFSIAAVDKIPKDNYKRSLFLILSPVAAGLILPVFLQGTGPMIAEDFISIIGMRTRNFNNVYISMNEYQKIDALLKVLSGVEQSVCYVSVNGREFVNIKISFGKEKDSIPLVVLWNDNSDHKIVGFDNRWTPNGPFEFPTFSISNNDFFELPKKFVNNC